MGNALPEAAFAYHVDVRTTELRCTTIEKSKEKLIGSLKQNGLRNAKNPHQHSQINIKSTPEVHSHLEPDKRELRDVFLFYRKAQKKEFAMLDIILSNRKGVHNLKAKVDTGAEGSTLSLRTF